MSNTRYADNDDELHQNRWSSSPEFAHSINALPASKRIREIEDAETRKLLWWIQWRSLQPRGLKVLAKELLDKFPDRIGTPAFRKIARKVSVFKSAQVRSIRDEILSGDCPSFQLRGDKIEEWGDSPLDSRTGRDLRPTSYPRESFGKVFQDALPELPEHLVGMVLNPEVDVYSAAPSTRRKPTANVWYFDELVGALHLLRKSHIDTARARIATTRISSQIIDTLEFFAAERRMVLLKGMPGIGKTITAQSFCDMQAGMVRYVETPSSNADRDFYAAIAVKLGVADGASYNTQQIKAKVEQVLDSSEISLLLDECQMLWPQHARPQSRPARMQWIKTRFDAGTPFALIGLPEFSDWQQLYVKKSLWKDHQLDRRLNRTTSIDVSHSREDLIQIARTLHPEGDEPVWELLAAYALASAKKSASAIAEALCSARYNAIKDGRTKIEYEDVESAVQLEIRPLEQSESSKPNRISGAMKGRRKGSAKALQPVRSSSSHLTGITPATFSRSNSPNLLPAAAT